MKKLVLATRNKGKVWELAGMLAAFDMELLSLDDFPLLEEIEEDGKTFAENATKKAEVTAAHTAMAVLADDSGLEVDYLNGAPGVYSARFSKASRNDEDNNNMLLALLADVPWEKRTARFQCVIAIALPGSATRLFRGSCEGIIGGEPQGEMGFGYDPLFYLPEYGKTFAQLELSVKNQISHRGKALAKALAFLEELARV